MNKNDPFRLHDVCLREREDTIDERKSFELDVIIWYRSSF